ncbi:MAG: hypothetical protein KBH45_18505, partial [Verrucomicrobia bacterium]|nr:hypothetical protein [Verrucomicrobiota bacterium]
MRSDFCQLWSFWRAFLAAASIMCASVTMLRAAASIEFTSVPPYGSFNNLQGRVHGITPATNRIAVFIYI